MSFLQSQCGCLKEIDFSEAVHLLQVACEYSVKSEEFHRAVLARGACFDGAKSRSLSELMSGPGDRAGPSVELSCLTPSFPFFS